MRKKIGRFIHGLLSFFIIGALLYYLYDHREIFHASAQITWSRLFALTACVLATWVLNSIQMFLIIRMEHYPVSLHEIFIVQMATVLTNHLPMRAGTVLRFHYFKKIHGIDYSRLGGMVALRIIILLTTTGLLGCIGLAGLQVKGTPGLVFIWPFFAFMLITPMAIYFFADYTSNLPDNLTGNLIKKLSSGVISIKSRPKLASLLLFLMLCQFVVLTTRLIISFDAIQIQLTSWILLLLAPTATLMSFITITPGNLALREWVIGYISKIGGYPFENAIFAGSLDRLILVGCTFTLGFLALGWVLYRLNDKHHN